MATSRLIILVILVLAKSSLQDVTNNRVDEDVSPLEEAKAAILKEQKLQNIGGMLNNLMQSDGAKQLGDMLLNAATGDKGGDILQGLGAMLGQGQGIDPSVLGAAMSMLQPGKKSDQVDVGSILSLLGGMMGQQEGGELNLMGYLPMILQSINAFVGPEAEGRARSHSGHSKLMPPIMERIHLFFDNFMNSDLGKLILSTVGAEKFAKVFTDESGKYSYQKVVDMLENHSFRKHWISMVTNRIGGAVSYFSEPKTQAKYLATFQHFLNSVLKSQGYPKSTLFDYNRPVETLTNLANHFAKQTLKMKIDSKQYVKPAVQYIQEVFNLAQKRGVLSVDHRQLSDKLADTINMEVIEPIARVNRAYRFATKVPQCDKYVMCLVNQKSQDDNTSLPGLKNLLSKSSSLIFSWFLSSQTGTSFWTLYSVIVEENNNCQAQFLHACNDFHVEEIKVTTEYVHSEL